MLALSDVIVAGTLIRYSGSTRKPWHPLPQFLIGGMSVDGRRERAHMPCESLREEQIPRGPVDVRDRSMAEGVQGVEPVEPGLHLPRSEGELNTPRRDPALTSL